MALTPHYQGELAATVKTDKDNKKQQNVFPKALSVVWGNDNRYWKLPKSESDPLELLQVCWLEVTGSVDAEPGKRYEVGFNLSLTPDAFGWGGSHLYVMATRGNKAKSWRKISLDAINDKKYFELKGKIIEADPYAKDKKIYFGLYEVWSQKWKGGLKIHNAFVREV